MDTNTNFDARAWLEKAATSANHGCGQVYELFEERLFGSIDGMLDGLPPDQRELLLAEAVAMFGYRDPAIIAAEAAVIREEEAELGIRRCVHHLNPDCCPLGCGDRDTELAVLLDEFLNSLKAAVGTPIDHHLWFYKNAGTEYFACDIDGLAGSVSYTFAIDGVLKIKAKPAVDETMSLSSNAQAQQLASAIKIQLGLDSVPMSGRLGRSTK
ncbi:MAG: hypothetical protein QM533_11585 [Cytophagales bacterium]|nr:hypothetical protein [Cytophagales bacterium]